MTATWSTVGPVRAALVALFASVVDTTVAQVGYGSRVTISLDQRVTVGGAVGTSAAEAMGPIRPMEEDYNVLCLASVTINTTVDDQQIASDAVLALVKSCALAVQGSPSMTLGVPGVLWALVEGNWELSDATAAETGGPIEAIYEFNVHVRARYALA